VVDNIKFNKILPSLSAARKVGRTDSRGRNKQQTPFKESHGQKQKKNKKENSDDAQRPESENSLSILAPTRPADDKNTDNRSHASESGRSQIIDIRV